MDKETAVNLAVKLVLPFVERNLLPLDIRENTNCGHKVLSVVEDMAKGLLEIEQKI